MLMLYNFYCFEMVQIWILGETIKNILKQQILLRNVLNDVLAEMYKLQEKMVQNRSDSTNKNHSIFLEFNCFPINSDEDLNVIEDYLENKTNFQAVVSLSIESHYDYFLQIFWFSG